MARYEELVDQYKPDMFWFDNGINSRSLDSIKLRFAAYYYTVQPNGEKSVSISTKSDAYLAGSIRDFERQGRAPKQLTDYVWLVDDPIGEKFGYVEGMKLSNSATIVKRLIENVCRNGSLMLNISPKSDGTIPDEQKEILLEIGKRLKINGEGIYDTRAWNKYGEDIFRFTRKDNTIYAIAVQWLVKPILFTSFPLNMGEVKQVTLLGYSEKLKFVQDEQGLKVSFPENKMGDFAYTLKD